MKRAKAKDVDSKDKISELPQAILQRILSLLYQREAARTSVLSKSWRYVWCTRPNLDFSDALFKGNEEEFLSVVDKTLQLNCEQRLGVEELSLSISRLGKDDPDFVRLLEKWISLLTNLCVKDFRLLIYYGRIDLPTIIFKAECLKILHLRRCMLLGEESTPVDIGFDRLQELRLEQVFIEQEIYEKVISCCPLLTTIVFQDCEGLETIKLEEKLHKYLKHFTCVNRETHTHRTDECSIEIDLPTLETIKIDGNKIRFHCHEFINLKYLSLNWFRTHGDNFVGRYHEPSCIIDAGPNLLHFEHVGNFIPSLSFKPFLRSSNVQVRIRGAENAQSWFLELSELLQALSQSKISLNITQLTNIVMQIQDGVLLRDVINGGIIKPVVVEDLQLNCVHVSSIWSFLNGLFCIFRPRKVTQRWSMGADLKKQREQKMKFVWYFLRIRKRENYRKIWHDLKDLSLSIEGFYKSRQLWQPLQWTALSECLLPDINSICIRLKWSEACDRVEF